LIKAARSGGPEKRLQFGKRLFDGIEVGTVRREEADRRADRFDGRGDGRLFVTVRLSRTTTSPGGKVGTKTCST
jgi:hypothetical protein